MNTPTRYPLQWPVGWKRTPYRVGAKFSKYDKRLSVFDGVQRVLRELERLGVTEADVVISTNLQTRLDGMPRSDQAQPADPGVCVYWQRGEKPIRARSRRVVRTGHEGRSYVHRVGKTTRHEEKHQPCPDVVDGCRTRQPPSSNDLHTESIT